MSNDRTLRERTIAFYEVVSEDSGEQKRIEQIDWQGFLSRAALADVKDLTFQGDDTYVGTLVTVEELDSLLLHRVKNRGEWLSLLNWETGEFRELESRASEGYLETTVICFLAYGNIIGIMQGATSAPTHKSFERWINGIKVFGSSRLVVRPLVSEAQVEKLRSATGANRIEIRIGASKSAALKDKTGRLAGMLRRARSDYGDINVTIIISIPRGKGREEDRRALLADLKELEEIMPSAAEKAKATLVYADEEGPEKSRLVELVEHHITAKRRIPAVDEEGRSVRILSAVTAILGVADQHEAELRFAADVPSG